MHSYDPAAHTMEMRDVVFAWIVAIAVCAILLATPDLAEKHLQDAGTAGLNVAIDDALPLESTVVADRRASRSALAR